ncbi:MAG: aromatic ring-hydroxylating dioxygenase subunit alpha [Rhodocyclaceae bacterium]|nr:aromatic ring-hydroxylating dioxygenase subunit alpha [Rhodocyclaceae bacterium]MBX3667400.1 aromatic ring-hydroxylating dioxygenase subunit alpha [Rhodocyclaceae bacterium]
MSEIASARRLARPLSQLPAGWYFSEDLFEIEKRLLFDNSAGYVGHELMVPEVGNYHTLEWMDHAKMLVKNGHGVELLSNICRHRQAIMLEGRGSASNIVCPIHRWTYDTGGKLLGAPHFPDNPCLHLNKKSLTNWQGMLFAGPRDPAVDLAGMTLAPDLDFSGYVLDHVMLHECNYNWKTFIEVYLEDYHVEPFHPGLGKFVSCNDLFWQFGNWYSVQRVGINNSLARPGTKTYERWHAAVLDFYQGAVPEHGAIWLTYYPNIMVEWYPHVLVVSHLIPRGIDRTTNVVEFYYPEEIALFEREFVEAEQAAYRETAREDDDIAERMDRGRRQLVLEGRNEVGPYQSPMEDGMQHFHEWYRAQVANYL